MIGKIRRWWKWRRVDRRHFPLTYTGPTRKIRGQLLETGTPLQYIAGNKGTVGGRRVFGPDNIIWILPESQIK